MFEEEEEEQIPQFYIEILNELDTFVNQVNNNNNLSFLFILIF